LALVQDQITQSAACTALDGLLELLGDIIDTYIVALMTTFASLLKTAPNKVKAVVIGAIGSAAHASKEKFLPYFEPIIKELVPFLMLQGEGEEEELRGIAMDACGTFAESVPKDAFLPYYEDLMKIAYEGVQSKSARLRECSFLFFGVMSSIFPDKFVPYLPNVVPAFLQTMKLDELGDDPTLGELTIVHFRSSSDLLWLVQLTGMGETSETPIQIIEKQTSEMDDIDTEALLKVNSAIAIEKEIAADVIGNIFASTKEAFLPYLEETAIVLQGLISHYYEGIRKSAIQSVFVFIVTLNELSNPPAWVAGGTNVCPS
jgi:importin-4